MEILLAILIGVLFAGGVYCLLRNSIMKIIIGVMLLSHGANLLVFSAAGITQKMPAFATKEGVPSEAAADPLPQALVLTAIVIGFGLVIFLISLLIRAYQAVESDDLDKFDQTDKIS